jgi:RNA polymerase sigma-70 factor (ECF subfamily)
MTRRQSEYARVYEQHVGRVYAFLAYRLGDRYAVEDLTLSTFERALQEWPSFNPARDSEAPWLLAIACDLVAKHRGSHDRAGSDGSAELAPALSNLSEADREVVALRFGGGLSSAEVAELLDLSRGDVEEILSSSLRDLGTLPGGNTG